MSGFRMPGPLCRFLGALEIDAGTTCLHTSPTPGPVGQTKRDKTDPFEAHALKRDKKDPFAAHALKHPVRLVLKRVTGRFITPEEGQRIVQIASTWQGVPYYSGGGEKSSKTMADCSGATWQIYKEAGFPYNYSSSKELSNNPRFKPAPGNKPQPGDIGQWYGHVLIFDPNAGGQNDSWSARRPGVPFGPAQTKWWASNGPVKWYRYDKPTD